MKYRIQYFLFLLTLVFYTSSTLASGAPLEGGIQRELFSRLSRFSVVPAIEGTTKNGVLARVTFTPTAFTDLSVPEMKLEIPFGRPLDSSSILSLLREYDITVNFSKEDPTGARELSIGFFTGSNDTTIPPIQMTVKSDEIKKNKRIDVEDLGDQVKKVIRASVAVFGEDIPELGTEETFLHPIQQGHFFIHDRAQHKSFQYNGPYYVDNDIENLVPGRAYSEPISLLHAKSEDRAKMEEEERMIDENNGQIIKTIPVSYKLILPESEEVLLSYLGDPVVEQYKVLISQSQIHAHVFGGIGKILSQWSAKDRLFIERYFLINRAKFVWRILDDGALDFQYLQALTPPQEPGITKKVQQKGVDANDVNGWIRDLNAGHPRPQVAIHLSHLKRS